MGTLRLHKVASSPLEDLVAAPTKTADYRSRTSRRTDLTLAARQLAQDIPQVVHHLLTLLSWAARLRSASICAINRANWSRSFGSLYRSYALYGNGGSSQSGNREYFQG